MEKATDIEDSGSFVGDRRNEKQGVEAQPQSLTRLLIRVNFFDMRKHIKEAVSEFSSMSQVHLSAFAGVEGKVQLRYGQRQPRLLAA